MKTLFLIILLAIGGICCQRSIKSEEGVTSSDTTQIIFYDTVDTLGNYVTPYYLFVCIVPPDNINEVTIWQKGKAQTYLHKVDSVTFKEIIK